MPPQKAGDTPLDMYQFRMLYNTCKVPGVTKDRLHNYFKTGMINNNPWPVAHIQTTCLSETCVYCAVTQRVKVLAPPTWWSCAVDGSSSLMHSVTEKSSLHQNYSGTADGCARLSVNLVGRSISKCLWKQENLLTQLYRSIKEQLTFIPERQKAATRCWVCRL